MSLLSEKVRKLKNLKNSIYQFRESESDGQGEQRNILVTDKKTKMSEKLKAMKRKKNKWLR